MATARDLIVDAAEACGALGTGESLSAEDAQMILRRLNRMLSSWNTERLMIYEVFDESLTLNGAASYSSASLTSTARPVRVEAARVTLDGIDYPVRVVTRDEYNLTPDKTIQADPPRMLYVQTGMADATLYFYPVPTTGTAKLSVLRPLPTTLALATAISLPPGYEKAIVDALAVDICRPLTGMQATADMVMAARESRDNVKRANYEPIIAEPNLPARGDYHVNSDSFV